jgi:hypothetical protein
VAASSAGVVAKAAVVAASVAASSAGVVAKAAENAPRRPEPKAEQLAQRIKKAPPSLSAGPGQNYLNSRTTSSRTAP